MVMPPSRVALSPVTLTTTVYANPGLRLHSHGEQSLTCSRLRCMYAALCQHNDNDDDCESKTLVN